jgi:hypothetical protein
MVNRFTTQLFNKEQSGFLSSGYSSYAQLTLPMRNGVDNLEPFVVYCQVSSTNKFSDIGLYYTINQKILIGASYKSFGAFSLHFGFHLKPNVTFACSRETYLYQQGTFLGPSNEAIIRFDVAEKQKSISDCILTEKQKTRRPVSYNRRPPPPPRKRGYHFQKVKIPI